MSDVPAVPPPEALASHAFPPAVLEVLQRLRGAGHSAYLVGGSIRDLLLGKSAKDYDVATSARAEAVLKLFRRVVPTGIKHGTVTVISRGLPIEVTTFRGEGEYLDGRRPETVFFLENVVEDLARRDFTMNAMAYDPTSHSFVDPFGGAEDLGLRRIRCVGDPRKRFGEDGLRPLRAVRFASVLGFGIDRPTLDAIPDTLETFGKVAHERVREEFSKLLLGKDSGRGLDLLLETGLLARFLPEVSALSGALFALARTRVEQSPVDLELRLAALLRDCGGSEDAAARRRAAEEALERLRYPRKLVDAVAMLVAERDFGLASYADDVALRRALARVGRHGVKPLLETARAHARALGDPGRAAGVDALGAEIDRVLAAGPALTPGELALNGQRVMQILACPPGPRVGEAMRFLLDRVLEAPELNRPESLEEALRRWDPDGGKSA